MGNKPSSFRRPSFSLKTSLLRLRKKVSRHIQRAPHRSIPRQAPPNPRRYRMRWMTRIRATSPAPSVRSIRGIWRFSNGSLPSIKHELRVVNCPPPQTPQSIDRYRKGEEQPARYDPNVEVTTTKETHMDFARKHGAVSGMEEKHKSDISRLKALPGEHTVLWHLERARSLTISLRGLGLHKSQIDEPSASVEIRSATSNQPCSMLRFGEGL